MEKYKFNKSIGGKIVNKDDRYIVTDNNILDTLVLSSTNLNPNKSTGGHSHVGQEEIYFFIKGSGEMELDDKRFSVCEGEVVLIKSGVYHRVHSGDDGCYFICVFNGNRKQ